MARYGYMYCIHCYRAVPKYAITTEVHERKTGGAKDKEQWNIPSLPALFTTHDISFNKSS